MALQEKVLSNGVTSPLEPSSKNCCEALPPMEVRSATTVMPVLGGAEAGVTATVSRELWPASTAVGLAAPMAEKPHEFCGVALLRGAGATAAKSVLLLFVSVQPPLARRSPVVLLGAGAFAVSLQLAVAP